MRYLPCWILYPGSRVPAASWTTLSHHDGIIHTYPSVCQELWYLLQGMHLIPPWLTLKWYSARHWDKMPAFARKKLINNGSWSSDCSYAIWILFPRVHEMPFGELTLLSFFLTHVCFNWFRTDTKLKMQRIHIETKDHFEYYWKLSFSCRLLQGFITILRCYSCVCKSRGHTMQSSQALISFLSFYSNSPLPVS